MHPPGGLLQQVRAKIEREYGFEKSFTHWDFDELLGEDKAADRNRISVMLCSLKNNDILKVDKVLRAANGGKYNAYKALCFPLSLLTGERKGLYKTAEDKMPQREIDNIFFNLGGRKCQNQYST
jgi:hypothetical protein